MRRSCATAAAISFLLSGCVQHRDLPSMPAATVNNDSITIWAIRGQEEDPDFPVMKWCIDPAQGGDTIKVPYHPSYAKTGCMVLEGHFGGSKASYPIVLDTGAPGAVFVNGFRVREGRSSVAVGEGPFFCRLEALQIGPITLRQPPCWYIPGSSQAPAKDETVIVGLSALRELSYVRFDNVHREAELSCKKPFHADDPSLWSTYPLIVEQDARGYPIVYTEMAVAGEVIRWQLDTGSGRGLSLDETTWTRLSAKLPHAKLEGGEDLYPCIGRLPCRHGVLDRMRFGNRVMESTHVSIFPDDSILVRDCHALLGMECLRSTVIVLDFRNATFWVRQDRPVLF